MNNIQKFNSSVAPMFLPKNTRRPMTSKNIMQSKSQDNNISNQQPELSVFDVKELYDLAYTYEKTDEGKFKALLSEALQLDVAYRRQLAAMHNYKDINKENEFTNAVESETTQVA